MAILEKAKRKATIIGKSKGVLLSIDSNGFYLLLDSVVKSIKSAAEKYSK